MNQIKLGLIWKINMGKVKKGRGFYYGVQIECVNEKRKKTKTHKENIWEMVYHKPLHMAGDEVVCFYNGFN